jgi:3-isopropylmalate/(R)-2-methylmalate dehydratase small subunit
MPKVVLVLGDDVSTDVIYPGRYMATVLPAETPQFAFADDPAFNQRLQAKQVPAGSVIAAGRNFGCGSSREQAVSCLRGHGLTVVARGFARIFLQNAVNVGLHVVLAPEWDAREGDELEIGVEEVVCVTSGRRAAVVPFPPTRQAVIDAGGLVPYTRRRVAERASAAPRVT